MHVQSLDKYCFTLLYYMCIVAISRHEESKRQKYNLLLSDHFENAHADLNEPLVQEH